MPCRAMKVSNNSLVDRDKVLFPLVHVELGFIKQFNKALYKDGGCFTYFYHAFLGVT